MFAPRRYRAYPTAGQETKARQFIGACRAMYNLALEQRTTQYELSKRRSPATRENLGYAKQTSQLKELRDDADIAPWLKEVPSQCLQQSLQDLNTAFDRFFEGTADYPGFKAKHRATNSFRAPQHIELRVIDKRFAEIRMPKMGWVKVRYHRSIIGKIKSATLTQEPDGKWYISLLCETNETGKGAKVRRRKARARLADPTQPTVGIDAGIEVAVATSDGDLFDSEPASEGEKLLMKHLQRREARQMKASKNRRRTRGRINKLHARARHRRRDFAEQVSHRLTKNYGLIVREDLSIPNMTKSARGTIDEPGRNVGQKSGLNREILNKAWGLIFSKTEEKAGLRGCHYLKVPAHYSSQECPECHHIDKDSRVTRGFFVCTKCGHRGHADIIASQNILGRGIELAQAGGMPAYACSGYEPESCSDRALTGAAVRALGGHRNTVTGRGESTEGLGDPMQSTQQQETSNRREKVSRKSTTGTTAIQKCGDNALYITEEIHKRRKLAD